MPYVFVSTQVRLENSPCTVGDEHSDAELMRALDAKMIKMLGNNFLEWRTELLPRQVLNRLEEFGYSVVGITGVGQTCIWTLHKPPDNETEKEPVPTVPAIPSVTVTNGNDQVLQ